MIDATPKPLKAQDPQGLEAAPKEDDEMTLCIAGECRHKGKPAIVLIADSRVERGAANPIFSDMRIGAEDAQKVRDVGNTFRALISGPPTMGDELISKFEETVVRFEQVNLPDDFDLLVTKFFEDLRRSARERKKEIVEHFIGMNTPLSSTQDFLDKAKTVFSESHYSRLQDEIRSLSLGGDIILAGFHDEAALIIRMDAFGGVHWEDHYSVIGAGADTAYAILALNPWDEEDIDVAQCAFRLFEAKVAAQTNKTVGNLTQFEVMVMGEEDTFDISLDFFELIKSKLRFLSIPEIVPPDNFLEPMTEEDDKKETPTDDSSASSPNIEAESQNNT